MRDNEYIIRGYRIGYQGWFGGFKTIFMIHNETGSIWTHLLGKLFYLGVVVFILTNFPSMSTYGQDAEAAQLKSGLSLQEYLSININSF